MRGFANLKKKAAAIRRYFRLPITDQRLFLGGTALTISSVPFQPGPESLLHARKTVERILTENIIPFWYPEIVDEQDGGYRLNHSLDAKWLGPANKSLVAQARTIWFFSRLANSKYASAEYLAAAGHGYEFLRDRMWDDQFGGFFWEVDASGKAATVHEKRSYGQAFALYALTEYAIASQDVSAQTKAGELFRLIDNAAYDRVHGGYRDICRRDWSPLSGGGAAPNSVPIKRMNTHLHLLEAIKAFFVFSEAPAARERLIELILINSNSVVRKNVGACTERYLENWQPLPSSGSRRVCYGHDLENVWLLVQACKVAGFSSSLLLDLHRTLFQNALKYGFDRKKGGFYDSGPLQTPADRREKIWWVQAEGLVAALLMCHITGIKDYWNCFLQTLDWIDSYQADWTFGDWYEKVGADGKPSGCKAGPWKSPYHNGRAMLECLDLLDSFE